MKRINVGRYPDGSGWIEDEDHRWIMFFDDDGKPTVFWPERDPDGDGAVVGDAIQLSQEHKYKSSDRDTLSNQVSLYLATQGVNPNRVLQGGMVFREDTSTLYFEDISLPRRYTHDDRLVTKPSHVTCAEAPVQLFRDFGIEIV